MGCRIEKSSSAVVAAGFGRASVAMVMVVVDRIALTKGEGGGKKLAAGAVTIAVGAVATAQQRFDRIVTLSVWTHIGRVFRAAESREQH